MTQNRPSFASLQGSERQRCSASCFGGFNVASEQKSPSEFTGLKQELSVSGCWHVVCQLISVINERSAVCVRSEVRLWPEGFILQAMKQQTGRVKQRDDSRHFKCKLIKEAGGTELILKARHWWTYWNNVYWRVSLFQSTEEQIIFTLEGLWWYLLSETKSLKVLRAWRWWNGCQGLFHSSYLRISCRNRKLGRDLKPKATANSASEQLTMLTSLITATVLKDIKVLTSVEPVGQC